MQDSTMCKPHLAESRQYLLDEIAECRAIYVRLFPQHRLRLVFLAGDTPLWAEPVVEEGDVPFGADRLSAEYLGFIDVPGPRPDAPAKTVTVSIPRRPTPDETAGRDAPWQPPRLLRRLFGMAPGLYEHIRYRAEKRRIGNSRRQHWKSLPFSRGTDLLLPAVTPVATSAAVTGPRPAILIGFHWLEVGGAEKMAFDCVHWALEAGLRVFVVAGTPSLQRLASRLPDHPDVQFIRLDRYLPAKYWPQYVEHLVRDENIRLVHIHHCIRLYDALPHIRVMTPWVQVIDTTHIVEYADGGYPRVSGVWSNYIDLHHVISRGLADFYRDRFHALHKVKLGRMLTRHEGEAPLPALNMAAGKKTLRVAFIGRYYYQKRPIVLARTLGALARWARHNGVDLRATLVGEGPFRPAVEHLVRREGMADAVEFLDAAADVPALLRKSDILLLPSNNEGLALVCYEAIEQGCIPISTDVGAQGEIVPPGLLVPHEPGAAVRQSVAIVDRLWRDGAFLAEQGAALQACYRRLAADPTAAEVLMPIYRAAATGAPALDDIL